MREEARVWGGGKDKRHTPFWQIGKNGGGESFLWKKSIGVGAKNQWDARGKRKPGRRIQRRRRKKREGGAGVTSRG